MLPLIRIGREKTVLKESLKCLKSVLVILFRIWLDPELFPGSGTEIFISGPGKNKLDNKYKKITFLR